MFVTSTMDEDTPLNDAINLIIASLHQYHPDLADRAAHILEREGHNIIDNPERVTGMQQCRPAYSEPITDVDHDMYISKEDFEERFSPNFTEMGNSRGHAVIDFEYLRTPESIIFLSHEIGHAIAFDIQADRHLTHKNFSLEQLEEQAYFVQSIVSHYTGISSPEGVAKDDYLKLQFAELDSPKKRLNRPELFKAANSRFKDSLSMDTEQRNAQMIMALAGNFDDKDLPPAPSTPKIPKSVKW